jgi:hypothetical protein
MNTIFCQWVETDSTWTCEQCGAVVPKEVVPQRPIAACRVGAEKNGIPFRNVAMATAGALRPSLPRYATYGPGSELKRLLARIGFTAAPGCKCNQRTLLMNQWGADECERRVDEIVGWLREEHDRRRAEVRTSLPWSSIAASALVKLAIRKARIRAVATGARRP